MTAIPRHFSKRNPWIHVSSEESFTLLVQKQDHILLVQKDIRRRTSILKHKPKSILTAYACNKYNQLMNGPPLNLTHVQAVDPTLVNSYAIAATPCKVLSVNLHQQISVSCYQNNTLTAITLEQPEITDLYSKCMLLSKQSR